MDHHYKKQKSINKRRQINESDDNEDLIEPPRKRTGKFLVILYSVIHYLPNNSSTHHYKFQENQKLLRI